jgi:hypothetical protein
MYLFHHGPRPIHPQQTTMHCRHPSGGLKREEGEKAANLTVQGFNAARLASVQAAAPSASGTSPSNQVNILNLPLPEAHLEEGDPCEAYCSGVGDVASWCRGMCCAVIPGSHDPTTCQREMHAVSVILHSHRSGTHVDDLNLPPPPPFSRSCQEHWRPVHIGKTCAGNESGEEVAPEDAEFNPAHAAPLAPIAQHPSSAVPPGAEAALQALDHAFGVAPLPILSSLSGAFRGSSRTLHPELHWQRA